MNNEFSDMLEFYLLDSKEQLDNLSAGLLRLEKEENNIAFINELFRNVHSLKGSSGTMGFDSIVHLAHAAEDLLDSLRQGKMGATFEIIDVLLEVTDCIKAMIAQIENKEEINIDYGNLVTRMKRLQNEESEITHAAIEILSDDLYELTDFNLSEEELKLLQENQQQNQEIYQINILFDPAIIMRPVRAVMVKQRLKEMGTLIKVIPEVDTMEEHRVSHFSLLFATSSKQEEMKEEVLWVTDIKDVIFLPYKIDEVKKAAEKPKKEIQNAVSDDSPKTSPSEGNQQIHTIRVDTARMDNLINMVGEMVITRTRLVQATLDLKAKYRSEALVTNLDETNIYLGRLMNDLQESVMRLRMVPIGTVFSRFPRLVRDLSRKTNKEIDLVTMGEDTELDKTVVESIGDPLLHIIRNSADHGIEHADEREKIGKPRKGTITLNAYHEGNHILIKIVDDGGGLNLPKIKNKAIEKGLIPANVEMNNKEIAQLIFLPGFSTADEVTDISGRGVGMDVVKKTLNSLGGMVDIETEKDKGTTFTIKLPLTLAIIQALLVELKDEIYAIPLSSVSETLLISQKAIHQVGGVPMIKLRGKTLPLISLREQFGISEESEKPPEVFVVVIGLGDDNVGILVDKLRGQQEIVIKSMDEELNNVKGIAGATILGNGQVTLILDVSTFMQDVLSKHIKTV